jgi:hypothetical protein
MKSFLMILCAGLLLFAFVSSASAYPFDLSSGQSMIFSFDFSSSNPAPDSSNPYDRVSTSYDFDILTHDFSEWTLSLFDDLNDPSGSLLFEEYFTAFLFPTQPLPADVPIGGSLNSSMLGSTSEPIQYISLSVSAGAIRLNSLELAMGVYDSSIGQVSSTQFVAGQPMAPVPEPSTIVLMGIGLVGLAGFGRKKFKK